MDCIHFEVCNRPCPINLNDCPHYRTEEVKKKSNVIVQEKDFINRFGMVSTTRKFCCEECGFSGIRLYDNYCANCGLELEKENLD